MVRSATCNATSRALDVAALIACAAEARSAEPMSSIGLPAMWARRAARLGCSSAATAPRSAARSRSVMGRDSISGCAPCGISEVLASSFPLAGGGSALGTEPGLGGGLANGRRGDASERAFCQFVNPELEQPRSGNDRDADRPDDPLPERLGEYPGGPIVRELLAGGGVIAVDERAQRCDG